MIYYTLGFTILICVNHHRSGVTATNSLNADDGNSKGCEEMKKPGWSIYSLANVTMDTWPWSCLNSRYTEIAINEEISKFSPDVFDASAKGYIGYVQYYIDRTNLKYFKCNDEGLAAIILAIKNGHLRVVKYLMNISGPKCQSNSIAYETENELRLTLPESAAFYGQLDILKYLLKEIESTYDGYPYLRILAFKAAMGGQHHILQYLIHEKGFVIRQNDTSLLLTAARGGNIDMLKYLLYEKNIKPGMVLEEDYSSYLLRFDCFEKNYFSEHHDCQNSSFLCNAARGGKLDSVVFFVEKLNYTLFINHGKSVSCSHPLVAAVKSGSLPVIKYMIEEKGADFNRKFLGTSLLNVAAEYGHLPVVKYLVEQKQMDVDFETYTWIADRAIHTITTPLYDAIRMGRLDVVKYLAGERNASLNILDGSNALIQASSKNNLEIVKYLVDDMKMKSRIDEIDDFNRTAVMEAAYHGQLNILKFLIDDRHANITIGDSKCKTLLHFAAARKDMRKDYEPTLKYLIEEKGMKVSARTTRNDTVLDIARRRFYFDEKILTYLSGKLEQES